MTKNDSACPAGKPWGVRKETDNSLEGCHATQREAENHMRALYANEGAAAMHYSIRQTKDGWQVVNVATGKVVASFTGDEHAAYADAMAHLATVIERDRLDAAPDAEVAPAVPPSGDDGLLAEHWDSPGGIAFRKLLPGGRDFTENVWSWRDPATNLSPLMLQTKNLPAHMEAELAGFATEYTASEDGSTVYAQGRFYDNPAGQQARDFLLGGRSFGVSVDPSEKISAVEDCAELDDSGLFCLQPRVKFTEYEIAGLTMVPFPGFEDAAIKLAASEGRYIGFGQMFDGATLRAAAPQPGDAEDAADQGADEAAEGDKSTHDEVNYGNGDAGSQCQDCTHYQDGNPPHCAIVEDPISATGTCDKFAALQMPMSVDLDADIDETWWLAKYTAEELRNLVDKGQAMGPKESPSYPVADCDDAGKAVHAVGRGSGDHDAIRRHIMKNVKRLGGCGGVVPANWQSDGSVKASEDWRDEAFALYQAGDELAAQKVIVAAVAARKLEKVAASISIPPAPPRDWFELPEPKFGEPFLDGLGDDVLVEQRNPIVDPNGRTVSFGDRVLGHSVPFEIRDDGLVYGHLTYWGQCHIGNPWGPQRCASVSPSESNYDDFYGSSHVITDDGSDLRCGLLHVGCQHSEAMDVRGVRDAAAHSGLAFAQVRVIDGEFGPWLCGSLLPTITEEQVVKLRALTLSGEWVPELGAVIAVNSGGLPQQRVDRIAASSGAVFPVADRVLRAELREGEYVKIIGGNAVYRCADCQKKLGASTVQVSADERAWRQTIEAQLDRLIRVTDVVESRTRHLRAPELDSIRATFERQQSEEGAGTEAS